MDYDYTWLGYGLLVVTPNGTRLIEGDEARTLHNELNEADGWDSLKSLLSDFIKRELTNMTRKTRVEHIDYY